MYNPGRWQRADQQRDIGQHIGQVYRNEAHLADSVSCYIADGLAQQEAVVVIATAAHWAALVERLTLHHQIDLASVVISGQLRVIDTDVALAALLTKGMPDENRMRERGSEMIDRARRSRRAVRMYSDMAGLLWRQGNQLAAKRLEQLSSELCAKLGYTLLCGCLANENDAHAYNAMLDFICSAHPRARVDDMWNGPNDSAMDGQGPS